MSNPLKKAAIDWFVRFLRQEDVMKESDRQFNLRHRQTPDLANVPSPYPMAAPESQDTAHSSALFVSGRFRSGSTLLWNLFRQMEGVTAYYEPFNERRWFDPAYRGERIDTSHRGVSDYWTEYDGLKELGKWYREDWIREALYMDAESYDADMQRYIDLLINRTQGTAVLQFNRVDFRLPWLKARYPTVPILHLYRNPRNQWLSFLTDKAAMGPDTVQVTYRDAFYLDVWCKDLARHFPYLDKGETPHPYRRFYYLWKLSWLFGQRYADRSIGYEDLINDPKAVLEPTTDQLNLTTAVDWPKITSTISPPQPEPWRDYADEDWFAGHEMACETVLNRECQSAANVSAS